MSEVSAVTPELVVSAYRQGYFPMASGRFGEIGFYYFEPRGIIPLDGKFAVRKSLRKIIDSQIYHITFDRAFEDVIKECARFDKQPDTEIWISEEIISIYTLLHTQGTAHSVEVWKNDGLIGGLYGLTMGSAFFGESMFSVEPFASQVALVGLVDRLRSCSYTLLDAQMESEHLKQFGMYSVSQAEYLKLLSKALDNKNYWE